MNLLRYYDPLDTMAKIQDEMSRRLFNRMAPFETEDEALVTSNWMPTVDIEEEPDRFLLRADVPGVETKDVEVTVESGVLSIKGERRFPTTEEQSTFKRVERPYGVFYRRFALPDAIDMCQVPCDYIHELPRRSYPLFAAREILAEIFTKPIRSSDEH